MTGNKYEKLMDAYRAALHVLEDNTGIDAHLMKVRDKKLFTAEKINTTLEYMFYEGDDYAASLWKRPGGVSGEEIARFEKIMSLYSKARIRKYENMPEVPENNKEYPLADAHTVLHDALNAFHIGMFESHNRIHEASHINDYLADAPLYVSKK